MKIQLITPLDMQWVANYLEIFQEHEIYRFSKPLDNNSDLMLFMWCDQATIDYINKKPKKAKYVVWIRRYEYYTPWLDYLDWSKVDAVIAVNPILQTKIQKRINRPVLCIANGVDINQWRYDVRQHGNKIACVGFVNQKKNYPLAVQILAALPSHYELHIAGAIQEPVVADYLHYVTSQNQLCIRHHGQVENIDAWLEDKNYLLSTAISEGCPNNVIEAMAKGIKPLIHSWPGAFELFGDLPFITVKQAVDQIHADSPYVSSAYKSIVETKFGLNCYLEVKTLCEKLLS